MWLTSHLCKLASRVGWQMWSDCEYWGSGCAAALPGRLLLPAPLSPLSASFPGCCSHHPTLQACLSGVGVLLLVGRASCSSKAMPLQSWRAVPPVWLK